VEKWRGGGCAAVDWLGVAPCRVPLTDLDEVLLKKVENQFQTFTGGVHIPRTARTKPNSAQ
jgi:hypothetical protein